MLKPMNQEPDVERSRKERQKQEQERISAEAQRTERTAAAKEQKPASTPQKVERPGGPESVASSPLSLEGLRNFAASLFPALASSSRKEIPKEKETPKERSQPVWYTAVSMVEAIDKGATVQVERSFPSRFQAARFAHGRAYFVYPGAFAERPLDGTRLYLGEAQSPALKRKLREERWVKEHQGHFHELGVWHDTASQPFLSQRIRSELHSEYRGMEFTLRVTPLTGAQEPGESEKPLYVVYHKHDRRPGRGEICWITHDEAEAKQVLVKLDVTERIRKTPPTLEETKLPARDTLEPVKSFSYKNYEVDVVRRTEKNNQAEHIVFLTKLERQEDGLHRRITTEHRLSDLVALSRKSRGNEQLPPTEAPKPPQKVSERPTTTKISTTLDQTTQPVPRNEGQEKQPSHFIAVWHGADPPRKDQWVVFSTNHDNKLIPVTPYKGTASQPAADSSPKFVLVKRLLAQHGLAMVIGSTKDLTYAEERLKTILFKEDGTKNYLERTQRDHRREDDSHTLRH